MVPAVETVPLPLAFSVEGGAYIDAIPQRALDMRATSLAYRHGLPDPDYVCFPVAKDEAAFLAGKVQRGEVRARPAAGDRAIIESLKPNKGGNPAITELHHLDIVRLHRRVLTDDFRPLTLGVTFPGAPGKSFIAIRAHVGANGEPFPGFLPKAAQNPHFRLAPFIVIDESTRQEMRTAAGSASISLAARVSIVSRSPRPPRRSSRPSMKSTSPVFRTGTVRNARAMRYRPPCAAASSRNVCDLPAPGSPSRTTLGCVRNALNSPLRIPFALTLLWMNLSNNTVHGIFKTIDAPSQTASAELTLVGSRDDPDLSRIGAPGEEDEALASERHGPRRDRALAERVLAAVVKLVGVAEPGGGVQLPRLPCRCLTVERRV